METNRFLAETKLLALRMQLNPHFIFNSLTSVNSFILQNNVEQASYLLTKFSRLIRQVLENSQTDWVSLRKELNTLLLYIELEQLRCDQKFDVQFEVDDAIDQDTVLIPPFILQPYVDDAIWHGLLPMKDGRPLLKIRCYQMADQLVIQIQDNGVSRGKPTHYQSDQLRNYQMESMQLMDERLQLLNDFYEANAHVSVTERYGDNGLPADTCVSFTLKLR